MKLRTLAGLLLLPACSTPVDHETGDAAYVTEGVWGDHQLVADAPGRDVVDREAIDVAIAEDGTVHRVFVGAELELIHESRGANGWERHVVDSGEVGEYATVAVDAQGIAHIAYYDDANNDLKYARGAGESWEVVTVAGEGTVGTGNDIVVDGEGIVHVCYEDDDDQLGYATSSDGVTWQTETVAAGGLACRLVVDGGSVYVTHYHYAQEQLQLSTRSDATWSHEVVPGGGSFRSSLAMGPDGELHVVFAPSGQGVLAHVVKHGADWSEPVEIGPGYHSSLVIDEAGVLRLVTVAFGRYLRYYELDAEGWQVELIPHGSTLARVPELAAADGVVHVVYRDDNFHDFYALTRK